MNGGTGLPSDLSFATKGEPAIGLLREAYADDVRLDIVTGDEVYGACTKLRTYLETHGQAHPRHLHPHPSTAATT